MPNCDWSAYRAIARSGIICAFIFLFYGNVIKSGQAQDGAQAAEKQEPATPQQKTVSRFIQQRVAYNPNCSEPPTREDAEYCVEIRSTEATEQQAALAIWQIVLSGFGVAGVIATLIFTAQAARAASKAANIAERAMIEIERPWIIFEQAAVKWRDTPGASRIKNDWFVTFTFRNIGKIPAEILDCSMKIVGKAELKDTPDYSDSIEIALRAIFPVDETGTTNPVGPRPGREDELVAFGIVSYKGLNGSKGITGFAISIATNFPAFVSYGGEKYNYYK